MACGGHASGLQRFFLAATWLQAALLCGYLREPAMGAMHQGRHRAYVTSEHDTRATTKAFYPLSYQMPAPHVPAPPCAVARRLEIWLQQNAFGINMVMHHGGCLQSTRCRASQATCVMILCALKLLRNNVQIQTVCVGPPGDQVILRGCRPLKDSSNRFCTGLDWMR